MCTTLCARKVSCLLPMGGSCSLSLLHGTLVLTPLASLSILTHGVPTEEPTFLLQQLDLQGMCANPTISCECFHNGVVFVDNPQQVDHGDYVSCWILTRTLQPSNPHCSEESAEEEPDGEFESNHSLAPSPRPPALKRSVEGHRVSERGAGRTSRGHSVPVSPSFGAVAVSSSVTIGF